jgi:hydroxyquinol 1,2-dioxygenase
VLDAPLAGRQQAINQEGPVPPTTATRNLSNDELTRAVLASFDGAGDERFREIAQALVRHLHAFASDVQLSEEEWFKGIDFLTRVGHLTDERRQEFVLLSDVLGLSMLVIGLNHRPSDQATESTVFGPFFVDGAPRVDHGGDLANGAPGPPCFVSGRILSVTGEPIVGARIDVWQADEDGFYDVQRPELAEHQNRGHLISASDGSFSFWTVLPVAYAIPADGPVGELLAAGGRGPMRPAHIHFRVEAPGCELLITHVFADGDEYLDSDAVFGVKESLVAPFSRHPAGRAPDGSELGEPFYTMNYDLVLEPARRPGENAA